MLEPFQIDTDLQMVGSLCDLANCASKCVPSWSNCNRYKNQPHKPIVAYSTRGVSPKSSNSKIIHQISTKMQQMFLLLSLALVASVVAQAAVLPAPVPYTNFPVTTPFAAATPLAVSSSQRLDYFNQFNAAFAPSARLLATPADLAAFSAIFGLPAAAPRFGQPARFIAAAPAPAPFIF